MKAPTFTPYQEDWKDLLSKRTNESSILFDAVFAAMNNKLHLVACGRDGFLSVWELPQASEGDEEDEEIVRKDWSCKPKYRTSVSKGTLYKLCCFSENNQRMLVAGGEMGVMIFSLESVLQGQPELLRRFKPYPSPLGAGDAFGCYAWDLKSKGDSPRTYSSDTGYIHAVHFSAGRLLSGGEDGVLNLWDVESRHGVQVERIDMNERNKRCWISSIVSIDDLWWLVAGGWKGRSNGGFLASIHAPTRSILAKVETRETIQQLAWNGRSIISTSNESVVTFWDSVSLETKRRVPCTSPSLYAVAFHEELVAVGGVGGSLDVFREQERLYTLSC